MKVKALVTQSFPTLWNPMNYSPPGSSVHGIHRAVILRCCHSCLQGIFPAQESNLHLQCCRQILFWLSHQGSHKNWSVPVPTLVLQTCLELLCGSGHTKRFWEISFKSLFVKIFFIQCVLFMSHLSSLCILLLSSLSQSMLPLFPGSFSKPWAPLTLVFILNNSWSH